MKSFCAEKCLAGGNPCFWLNLAKQGRFKEAWMEIVKYNPLPAITGKVCPHPCEDVCKRTLLDEPISINALEGYLGELALAKGWRLPIFGDEVKNFSVAVVGSGPAGLSCAYQLARQRYQVGIFEQFSVLGGMLRAGIPEFRLPRDILGKEIDNILEMGVGVAVSGLAVDAELLRYIRYAYDAVFFATGLQEPKKLRIPGETSPMVHYGLDFLKAVNLGKPPTLGRKVIVIGGGNTAIDVARTVKRLGSQVAIFYRRTKAEMPAIPSEVAAAQAEGIEIRELVAPVKIYWQGLECLKMRLGEPDETSRRKPIPINDSNFQEECDEIIIAAGEEKEKPFALYQDGELEEDGKVFIVPDAGTVAEAVKAGREAAEKIIKTFEPETNNAHVLPEKADFYSVPQNRIAVTSLKKMKKEALRCLGCGFEVEGLAEVAIDKERCKGCGLCRDVCPYRVLELGNNFNKQGYLPAISKNPSKCRGCSWCALICPDAAIEVRRC